MELGKQHEKEMAQLRLKRYDMLNEQDDMERQYEEIMKKNCKVVEEAQEMKKKNENSVRDILNQQVHSNISKKLMSKEKQIEDIEKRMKADSQMIPAKSQLQT